MQPWFPIWRYMLASWWALRLWLGMLMLCPSAFAVPQYVIQSWQTKDGLPQSDVTALLQTRDGYVWVGTYNGLARFDGVRFTVFDTHNAPGMHSQGINSLFEAADGTLWIGHSNGEMTRYQDGRFAKVEVEASWASEGIKGIGQDEAGDIWLMNDQGWLRRMRDGRLLKPQSGPGSQMATMATSEHGTIWVLRNGRVSQLVQGELKVLITDLENTNSFVQGIGASRDGGLWVIHDGRLRKWIGHTWAGDVGKAPLGQGPNLPSAFQMIETKEGWLAASVIDHGLFLWQPGKEEGTLQFGRTSALKSDWVTALMEDHEGNLWIGTGGAGLYRIRTTRVQTLSPPDQWRDRTVVSVSVGQDGGLWIGAEGAGLYRYKEENWQSYVESAGLSNLYVWSAVEDQQGKLWVATWGGGLYCRQGSQFMRAPGLETINTPMRAILSDKSGLWIGTTDGLLRYEGGQGVWFGREISPADRTVCTVIEDREGAVWFGMSGGGLGCLKEGRLKQFGKRDGLAGDFVACLHLDDNGALWIGTSGGGLTRLKQGRFAIINEEQGLPNNYICHIEEDDQGFFWMSSHCGIIRVKKEELEQCADGQSTEIRCLTYGLSDGMPTLECSGGLQPAGCKTTDGRLWFPTSKGLVVVDPRDKQTNLLPPPVMIENLAVDERPLAAEKTGSSPLRIQPGYHRFEFQYTGLSFAAVEKVYFKYRLEGLEREWVLAGTRRSAHYSYLPPGRYNFHVTACNNDGIWNETGATFAFIVLPYFWQTLWFRLTAGTSMGILVGGIMWLEMRRRLRRKLGRIERQRAIERERARIAKDIHDDLGASLTRIILLSQLSRNDLDDPALAAAKMARIYETARESTRAMDEIVWAVNPAHDTLASLASYLSKFAQDYVRAANLRCWFNVPTHLPIWPLTAELRHNLFLAFKEALHNVVKHAAASEVCITLTLRPHGFTLSIEDNGRGFSTESMGQEKASDPDRTGHGNGLANMQRRLSEIGGRCEVQSIMQSGTTVRLDVPVNPFSGPVAS